MKSLTGRDFPREKIRIRDNHTCQLCGLIWEKGRRLDIHHLNPEKDKTRQYDKPEEYNNCITLCHSCHLSLPVHRKIMEKSAKKWRQKQKFAREEEWRIERKEMESKIKKPTEQEKRKWNIWG